MKKVSNAFSFWLESKLSRTDVGLRACTSERAEKGCLRQHMWLSSIQHDTLGTAMVAGPRFHRNFSGLTRKTQNLDI